MESPELLEIREFFEQVEANPTPEGKLPLLKEAASAVSDFVCYPGASPSEVQIAKNLYVTYMRRVLGQVAHAGRLGYSTILAYIDLLPAPDREPSGVLYTDKAFAEAGSILLKRALAQQPRDGL